MGEKRIFISYSRLDTEYVSSLATALRKEGFDVWFDKNIRTGSDWDDTLETELKKADIIVLVMSKTSVASENVKDEMSYVLNLGKIITPIKIEDCDVPMRLARKQFVDFTTMGPEAGYERLVTDIRKNLEISNEDNAGTKGKFIPPKPIVPDPNHISKKRSSLKPYLIGGIIAVFLLVVVAMGFEEDTVDNADVYNNSSFTEFNDPDGAGVENSNSIDNNSKYNNPTNNNSTTTETTIAKDWAEATNRNTIEAYIQFLRTYGKNNIYYNDAFSQMKNMFSDSGYLKYGIVNVEQYFNKTLYFNGTELTIPEQGDFISPKMQNEIWKNNYPTGYYVKPGRFYLVLDIATDNNNVVWVHLAI